MAVIIIIIMFVFISMNFHLNADKYAAKKASLWKENSFVKNLYTDPKASEINDIVIIKISETSTASNKAGLSTAFPRL